MYYTFIILFDVADPSERLQRYIREAVRALQYCVEDYPNLSLHNRVAIVVPESLHGFEEDLSSALDETFRDRFRLVNALEASSCFAMSNHRVLIVHPDNKSHVDCVMVPRRHRCVGD